MIIANQFLTDIQEHLNYMKYLEYDDGYEKENCVEGFKQWKITENEKHKETNSF